MESNFDLLKRANCQHLDLVVCEEIKTGNRVVLTHTYSGSGYYALTINEFTRKYYSSNDGLGDGNHKILSVWRPDNVAKFCDTGCTKVSVYYNKIAERKEDEGRTTYDGVKYLAFENYEQGLRNVTKYLCNAIDDLSKRVGRLEK